jgi:hypothetical protein
MRHGYQVIERLGVRPYGRFSLASCDQVHVCRWHIVLECCGFVDGTAPYYESAGEFPVSLASGKDQAGRPISGRWRATLEPYALDF